jgi:anti-sigma regulatory factor (Ser/Thr protein kinase)
VITTVSGTLVDNGSAMRGPPGELLRLLMRCDASAPRRAREALRTVAAIDLVRSDAILVASELVSNAVMHAGCEPGEAIEFVVEMRSNAVRLAITDRGCSENTPTVRGPEYRGPGGLGLRIVETLAHRWGVERRIGTLVWADLSLDPPPEQNGTGLNGPPAQRSQPVGPAPRIGLLAPRGDVLHRSRRTS